MQDSDKIKMIDLSAEYSSRKAEFDEAILEVLERGDFIKGKAVADFENNLSAYLNVKNVVSCGNGTDALQIALMALGIGKGDEVILPAFSYIAVIEVVCLLGATPVLVDVEPEYFQMPVDLIAQAITPKTKVIVPVHLFGQCADMDALMEIAKKHHLYIVEDCAQAIGATYRQQYLGTIGHIGCTSFFPTKNLACYGDGGALMTNDDKIAEKIKMIASHGQQQKYHHEILGINSRLDTLQAAILNVKLKYLSASLEIKKQVAAQYINKLKDLEHIVLPDTFADVNNSWHQFTIRVKNGQRDELKSYLKLKNIDSMVYYPKVLNQQEAYLKFKGNYPVSETLTNEVLSLPVHDRLTPEQVNYICNTIKEFYDS